MKLADYLKNPLEGGEAEFGVDVEGDCKEAKTSDDSDDCAAGCERDSFGVFADDATAAEYGGDCGVW